MHVVRGCMVLIEVVLLEGARENVTTGAGVSVEHIVVVGRYVGETEPVVKRSGK